MDGLDFLGFDGVPTGTSWELPVTDAVCGARGQLFGGCALAAAVALLEAVTDRPAAWATAQFVANAFPPDVVTLDARLVAEGRRLTQGRVVGHVEGREVVTVHAGLGSTPFTGDGRWPSMPVVPPPQQCAPRQVFDESPGQVHRRVEQRIASGEWGDERSSPAGRVRAWMRFPTPMAATTVGLAVAADFLPLAIRAAFGWAVSGSSLDNTVRYCARSRCEWILADLRLEAVAGGIGHGSVQLWSPQGQLLALGSQTCSLRSRPAE